MGPERDVIAILLLVLCVGDEAICIIQSCNLSVSTNLPLFGLSIVSPL